MRVLFIVIGAALVAAHLLADLAGFDAYVTVLAGQVSSPSAAFGGLVYVVAWFGVVVGAPICFLAAILDRIIWRGRRTL